MRGRRLGALGFEGRGRVAVSWREGCDLSRAAGLWEGSLCLQRRSRLRQRREWKSRVQVACRAPGEGWLQLRDRCRWDPKARRVCGLSRAARADPGEILPLVLLEIPAPASSKHQQKRAQSHRQGLGHGPHVIKATKGKYDWQSKSGRASSAVKQCRKKALESLNSKHNQELL